MAPFIDSGINQFYRAKVISISRNEADVFFVDYGNNAQVPLAELKYIPKVRYVFVLLYTYHFVK